MLRFTGWPFLVLAAMMIITAWTGTTEVSAQSLPTVYFENINYNYPELEPGFATSQATVALRLTEASSDTVTVEIYSVENTATAGADYIDIDQTITFPPGTTRRETSITLLGDDLVEHTSRVRLHLRNPVGATLGADNLGQITISDHDSYDAWLEVPTVTTEGEDIPITIHFSHMTEYRVTFIVLPSQIAGIDHAATGGEDYRADQLNVTMNAFQLSKRVSKKGPIGLDA